MSAWITLRDIITSATHFQKLLFICCCALSSKLLIRTFVDIGLDLGSVIWTDNKGGQEDYAHSVTNWSSFHGKLPDNDSNKIHTAVR